jgi:hypothetical protein
MMSRAFVRALPIQSDPAMADRLLDRQVTLIDYLTSAPVLFGDDNDVPAKPALNGIDLGLLRLEARFCCNRRLKKIVAAFPRTFQILGADQSFMLRAFAETNRQTDVSGLANARQFYEFALAYWQHEAPGEPYLIDVAACEFSMIKVRMDEGLDKSPKADQREGPKATVRRSRAVVPLRCTHDIRPIFEPGSGEVVPPRRQTLLIVALPTGACKAVILEVAPVVFELLFLLDAWVDPTTLGDIDDVDNLIRRMAAEELIEVRA